MSNIKKILIDFEKVKDPFSGLGQFCLFLKQEYDKHSKNLNLCYFIPKKRKLYTYFSFLIPKNDVFHAIHQDCPYVPFFKKTKYLLTIHDLNAVYEAKNNLTKTKFLKNLEKKIKRADAITFISEFTKNETQKYFSLENKNCYVIYNGISLPEKSITPKYIPSKKFLFAIGTVLPKKNFHVLIEMMKYLPDYELIIAGTTFHKYAKSIIESVDLLNLNDRIHLIGTISNEEKRWYYEKAQAFVFPSLFEGFGLPVAEAMSMGLPLFLSKHTSIPEIGGPDAFYFENFGPIHMANTISQGLDAFNLDTKTKLLERSKMFNWEKAAFKYLELYKIL